MVLYHRASLIDIASENRQLSMFYVFFFFFNCYCRFLLLIRKRVETE